MACAACGKTHNIFFSKQNPIRESYKEYYYEGVCSNTKRVWLLADNGGMYLLPDGEH